MITWVLWTYLGVHYEGHSCFQFSIFSHVAISTELCEVVWYGRWGKQLSVLMLSLPVPNSGFGGSFSILNKNFPPSLSNKDV